MYVFIDESGDPGFKLGKGSSPNFVITMVIFGSKEDATQTNIVLRNLLRSLRVKPEFKFNKLSSKNKDIFFHEIRNCNFTTRSIVVQKDRVYSEHLRNVKDDFYRFFVRQMLQNDGGVLRNAKVIIDGSGDRHFKRQLKAYMRRELRAGCVSKINLKDSKSDSLIQLADMCVGAIARSYKIDRQHSNRWRDKLRRNGQISNIWEFK